MMPILLTSLAIVFTLTWAAVILRRATGRFALSGSSTLERILLTCSLAMLGGAITLSLYQATTVGMVGLAVIGVTLVLQLLLSTFPKKFQNLRAELVDTSRPQTRQAMVQAIGACQSVLSKTENQGGGLYLGYLRVEASKTLEKLRKAGVMYHLGMADHHLLERRYGEAADSYQAGASYGEAAQAFALAMNAKAALELVRSHKPNDYILLIEVFAEQHKFDMCAEVARIMDDKVRLAEYYRQLDNFVPLAQLLEEKGELREAADVYLEAQAVDAAIKIYEELSDTELSIAEILMKHGHYGRAALYFERLEMLDAAADAYRKADMQGRAGDALRKTGQHQAAAEMFAEADEHRKMAEMHTISRDFGKAAEAYALSGDFSSAADHYALDNQLLKGAEVAEQGGAYLKAGDLYTRAGEHSRAATAFVAGELYLQASDAYVELGQLEQAADCLVKCGALLKAAKIYVDIGDFAYAARTYEDAKAWAEASDCYRAASDVVGEARCLANAGSPIEAADTMAANGAFDQAATIYQRHGAPLKAAECLAHAGQLEAAAKLYVEHDGLDQALVIFRQLDRHEAVGDMLAAANRTDEAALSYERAEAFAKAGEMYRRIAQIDKATEMFEKCGKFDQAAQVCLELKNANRFLYFAAKSGDLTIHYDALRTLPFKAVIDAYLALQMPTEAIIYALHYFARRPAIAPRFISLLDQLMNLAQDNVSSLQRRHTDLIMSMWAQDFPILRARLLRLIEELEIESITRTAIDEKLTILERLFPYFSGLVAVEGPSASYREKIEHYFNEYLDLCGMRPPSFDVMRHVLAAYLINKQFSEASQLVEMVGRLPGREAYARSFKKLIEKMEQQAAIDGIYGFRETLEEVLPQRHRGQIETWADIDDLTRSVYHPESVMIRIYEDRHMHAEQIEAEFKSRYDDAINRIKIASRSDKPKDRKIALEAVIKAKHHQHILLLSEPQQKTLYHAAVSYELNPTARKALEEEYQAVFHIAIERDRPS